MSPADASFKLGSRGTGLKIDLYGLNKRSVMERLRALRSHYRAFFVGAFANIARRLPCIHPPGA